MSAPSGCPSQLEIRFRNLVKAPVPERAIEAGCELYWEYLKFTRLRAIQMAQYDCQSQHVFKLLEYAAMGILPE